MKTDFEQLVDGWVEEVRDLGLAHGEILAHAKAFFEGATGKRVRIVKPKCRKVRYGRLATAQKAALHMKAKTGDEFDCYQCPICDSAWHIGHRQDY